MAKRSKSSKRVKKGDWVLAPYGFKGRVVWIGEVPATPGGQPSRLEAKVKGPFDSRAFHPKELVKIEEQTY